MNPELIFDWKSFFHSSFYNGGFNAILERTKKNNTIILEKLYL